MNRDFLAVLERLAEQRVDFVLIGGVAANALGSPSITTDIDICYERSGANLERLVAALRPLHPRLRGAPDGLPFVSEALTLRNGDTLTLSTDAGPVDVLPTPSGTGGYDELKRNAWLGDIGGFQVWVCSLEDLIRMKVAAGRVKDRIELEVLGALRDVLEGRPE